MANVAPQSSRRVRLWRRGVVGISLLLWAGLALSYRLRPDAAAAVTVFPPWLWTIPGLLLAFATGPRLRGSRYLSGLWILLLLLFAEEPRSLLRPITVSPVRTAGGGSVRVVSLNCAGGSPEAAAEVGAWNPDLVLLQEVPAEAEVRRLARRLYGSEHAVIYGYDTAVLARAPLSASVPPRSHSYFVAARVTLLGATVEVVSLRLTPPVVRLDLWSPECWAEQIANRQARREQVAELVRHLETIPSGMSLIVGGDFNAPAGDAIFALLQPRLRDAFAEAGAGWGNTGLNDIPVSRVDQVWIDRHWRVGRVVARRTLHSDHQTVVADLWAVRN